MLKDVSFSLAPGECLGIIGPSGSGKSTLGKIIIGISAPTAGSVLLDGIDVLALHDLGGGRRFGYLPQDIDLFGETIKDIIARLEDADLQKVIAAAKLAGLHEAIIRLPQAYDTVVVGGGAQSRHVGFASASALHGRFLATRTSWFSTSRTPAWTISASACSSKPLSG